MSADPRRRVAFALAGATLAAGGLGWAGATVFADPPEIPAASHTLVRVEPGEVSAAVTLAAAAEWTKVGSGVNQAAGVVTSIDVVDGAEVHPGTVLYTIGLRPVVAASGVVPSFRDLMPGVAGADVAQLQEMLVALGYYDAGIDGEYGSTTRRAVEDWQRALGVEPDGVVGRGDVIYIPDLPARVVLDPEVISVGSGVVGGEVSVGVLADEPALSITVSGAQSASIPDRARVEIVAPTGDLWPAVITERLPGDDDTTVLMLENPGGTVCADSCDSVPFTASTSLTATVHVVEPIEGLVVPSAAIMTRPDGESVLLEEDGTERVIEVIASARGITVVEGAPRGLPVRIPAVEEGS